MYSTAWCDDRERLAAWRVRGTSTRVVPLTTPEEPVDVELLKLQSKIPDSAPDLGLLPLYLGAAREYVETQTGVAGLSASWQYSVDLPPYETGGAWLILPMSPVVSITSITSYDLTNVSTVMLNTTYRLDASSRPARVVLNNGIAWPSGLRATNGLVVEYIAGHGSDPELVPARLRQAILLVAAELYERREATTDLKLVELPFGLRTLLDQLTIYGPR